MLIDLTEYRCHLPLPERIIQGVVDGLGRNAKSSDGVAVDLQHHARGGRLEISRHVLQFRQLRKPVQHDGGPLEQLADVGILQRVLELGLADFGPDLHVLARLPKQGDPGNHQ